MVVITLTDQRSHHKMVKLIAFDPQPRQSDHQQPHAQQLVDHQQKIVVQKHGQLLHIK